MSFPDPLNLASCGLVWRPPGLWVGPEPNAVSFPAGGHATCFALEDRSFWFRHRNRCIAALVDRFATEGRFLDVGGGNGFVAAELQRQGREVVLVEPGRDGAVTACARGVRTVICARLEDANLPHSAFAAAGLFDVLEHMEDEAASLALIQTLLRPGGRLLVTVPAYRWLFSVDDVAAGHFRRYTRSGLSRTLRASGFAILASGYFFSPLPPLILLKRTLPGRLGLIRGADPKRMEHEHAASGVLVRLLWRALDLEFAQVSRGRGVPFGSSCFAVAERR